MNRLQIVVASLVVAFSRCAGLGLFLLAWQGLLGVAPIQADNSTAVPTEMCFVGAKPDANGLLELEAATREMYLGLKAHADDGHPSIRYWSVRRKGEPGCAYHFQYGEEGDFVLYHPDDYHISMVRDVKFKSGATEEQIRAALHNAAIQWPAIPVNDFANRSLIEPKNSGDGSTLRFFTFDFETSPNQGDRAQQRQWVADLADDVSTSLASVARSPSPVNSFHISFGLARAGVTSDAQAIQEKVIRALKRYGGYHPLHSSEMEIDSVAIMLSSHIDDATRYTTYMEEWLGSGPLAVPGILTLGTVYKAPKMLLESGATWTVAPYDRTLLGQIDEAELPTLLDWVETSDGLAVVSGNQETPEQGWLAVKSGSHFDVGVTSEEDTGHLVLGLTPGQVGSVLVTGAGSRLAVGGDIDVGEYGYGLLEAKEGATIASYGGYIGYRPGSNGAVSMEGAGTTWQVNNDFVIGYQGAGAMSLSQGARLLGNPTEASYLYVGSEVGSYGSLELTDPDTQIQFYDGAMIVGSAGSGTVSIRNQAAVFSASGYLGDDVSGVGAVEIAGAGSHWNMTQNLWLGVNGNGAMSIHNGASADCKYLTVAAYQGSTGLMVIADPQSACNVARDAFIGGWMDSENDVFSRNDWNNGGDASVTIQDGGTLSAGRTVWIGGHSFVQLFNGGSLNAENLDILGSSVLLSTEGQLNIRRQISVDGLLQTDAPLQIGDGMSLVGDGWIASPQTQLQAGSLLAPGHSIGSLHFVGDLRLYSGSRLDVELGNSGLCDRIAVSDTFTPGGTLTLHGLDAGGPSWAYQFASAQRITGTFDAVDASALPVAPKRVILSNHWGLIKFKDLRDLANTENVRQTAGVLDASIDAGQSNALTDQLITIGNDQVMARTLDQMTGELYATLSGLGVQDTANVYRVLSDRLRPQLAFGSSGLASSNSPTWFDADSDAGVFLCGNRSERIASSSSSPWGGWAVGYGLGGQARSDGNAHGVDYSTSGTLVAIERPLDVCSRWGAFYGYGGARVTTQTVDQLADIGSHQFGAFMSSEAGDDYCTLAGSMGYDDYRARRYIDFDESTVAALGDHHGWQSAAYLERGHSFRGQQWSLQPYGALQYIYLRQEAFAESGAGPLNLDVDGSNLNSFRGLLGSSLVRQLGDRNANAATLSFRTIWMHEFLCDTAGLVSTDIASIPGPAFALRGLDLGRDWIILGPGCTYTVRDHVSLFANYDLQFNSQQVFHVGSGGVQFAW